MRWEVVIDNLPKLLAGLLLGLEVAVASIAIGTVLGLLAAFARVSSIGALSRLAGGYLILMRNVPLLLLIFVAYYGLPTLHLTMLDNVGSLVLALSIYAGAYLM